jgi:hypothetical protein
MKTNANWPSKVEYSERAIALSQLLSAADRELRRLRLA